MIIMYMHIWTRNMCSAVQSIGYVKNQFLFYRIFQSLWSVWRAFWRYMVIMYVQILTKNMCLAVHSIGYVKNQFLFYRIFQSLWSVWRAFWRDMIIMYMYIHYYHISPECPPHTPQTLEHSIEKNWFFTYSMLCTTEHIFLAHIYIYIIIISLQNTFHTQKHRTKQTYTLTLTYTH